MFGSKPERRLDKEFFVVSQMIVTGRPQAEFDGHAQTLRELRATVGDDRYFDLLARHWQGKAHGWADAGVNADALMRALFSYCRSFDWLETSME